MAEGERAKVMSDTTGVEEQKGNQTAITNSLSQGFQQ